MKLTLAVALNLALLATAAPTVMKRDNGGAPASDMTSELADESLKNAAEMMDMYKNQNAANEDDKDSASDNAAPYADANGNMNFPGSKPQSAETDYGTNLPANMIPNSEVQFPGGNTNTNAPSVTEGETKDGGSFDMADIPSPASMAASSPSASPSPSATSPVNMMEMAEESPAASSASASPSPSSLAAAKPTSKSPLPGVPLLGSLFGSM